MKKILKKDNRAYLLMIFVAGLICASPALALADSTPSWLQQAALAKLPAYEKDVKAVVLYKDLRRKREASYRRKLRRQGPHA